MLEVLAWTGADAAFISITGGEARLAGLRVTIAALPIAHGCNIGYTRSSARPRHCPRPALARGSDVPAHLRMADAPGYRHQIKAQANLQEGRHALARRVFHGKNGRLHQNY